MANAYIEALKRQLGLASPAGLLGDGMAAQAAATIQNRPYQLHVQEAQALGQQPMTLEQFMQTQPKGLLGQ